MARAMTTPTTGEATGAQTTDRAEGLWSSLGDVLKSGFTPPPPAGPETYRKMRRHPTIFIARTVATTPIMAAQDPSVEGEAPEAAIEAAESLVARFFWRYARHALTSLDFGFAAFEKIWDGAGADLRIVRMKPLVAWGTEPLVDKTSGDYVGLKQGKAELAAERTVWYANDPYAGDLWGESRLDGLRPVWQWWNDAMRQIGTYLNKVAGVIPLIEYPSGESQNASGQQVSNFDTAKNVAGALTAGKAVIMPNTLANWAKEFARAGLKPDEIKAWRIQFLEAKGDHSGGMLEIARQLDRYMLRGYGVPERVATEGEFGTKADAGEHADLAAQASQQTLDDLTEAFHRQVIYQELLFRFGEDVAEAVTLRSPPITDESKALLSSIVEKLIFSTAGIEIVGPVLDIRAILERRGVPSLAESEEKAIPKPASGEDVMMSLRRAWERWYG